MKKKILFCVAIVSFFSWGLQSQKVELAIAEKKIKNTELKFPTRSDSISGSLRMIKRYKVVEKINMNFGGYTRTYIVSDPKLINTNDLGPNNTRVISIILEEEPLVNRKKRTINDLVKKMPNQNTDSKEVSKISDSIDNFDGNLERSNGTAYINILKTYERIIEKGYKSIDMVKKVANGYYFIEKLDKAAEFYKKLFSMTSDLEPEYYFRYAQSLKFINQKDKAEEMINIYNQKTETQNKN